WDCNQKQGAVERAEVVSLESGPVYAQFTARLDHVDLTAPKPPKKVLDETWSVQAYHVAQGVLLDQVSTQAAASSSPLQINEYHYGGLAFRGCEAWSKEGCECLTREGRQRIDGNQTRPGWVAMFGKIDGQMTGVLVMDHPQNFRHP